MEVEGIDYHVAFSDRPGHIPVLTIEFLKLGFERFAAVGGDGTLNELINGLFHQNIVSPEKVLIASIPIGTGNDWMKSHYPNRSVWEVIGLLAGARYHYQDIGMVTGVSSREIYFGNVAEFGFGGLVVHRVQRFKRLRLRAMAYLVGMVAGLLHYRPTQIHLTSGKIRWDKDLFNLVVAVGNFAGGGMRIAPSALIDDGRFEVIMIEPITPLKLAINIKKLFDGSYVKLPQVSVFQTAKFNLSSESDIMAEVDGEWIGPGRKFTISLRKKALRVLSP